MNIVNAGARYQVYGEDVQTYKELPVATYTIGYHPQMGFWLVKLILRLMKSVFMVLTQDEQTRFLNLLILVIETLELFFLARKELVNLYLLV